MGENRTVSVDWSTGLRGRVGFTELLDAFGVVKTDRRGFLRLSLLFVLAYSMKTLLSEIQLPLDERKAWESVGYDNYPGVAGRYEHYQERP